MNKIKEMRMTLIILLVGMFFLSGCFFSNKYEVAFKTNGGSEVENVQVKSGNTLEEPAAPKKEGFIFEGWYLDGEEYDFDKEVNKDITLVAKWRKVDIGDSTEPSTDDNNSTTTSSTTSTTSTKVTSKVPNTASNGTIKTTKKTTRTTKKTVELASTKKTTEKPATKPTNPTQKPTDPTKPTSPSKPVEPPVPEKEELRMNIVATEIVPEVKEETKESTTDDVKVEENEDTKDDTTPVTPNKYKYEINFASDKVNVISNITDNELQELLKSDKSKWILYNSNGYKYENNYAKAMNSMTLEGDLKTDSITIGVPVGTEVKYYTLDEVVTKNTTVLEDRTEVVEEVKWYINYPNVSLTTTKVVGENELPAIDPVIENYYYSSLNTALNLAKDNDTVSILRDMSVKSAVEVNKIITIVGNNHKIKYEKDVNVSIENYLFVIKDINSLEGVIKFENIEFDVESLMNIEHTALFKTLELINVKTKYAKHYIINNSSVSIDQDPDTSFTYGALL